jgi:hypothetical protein
MKKSKKSFFKKVTPMSLGVGMAAFSITALAPVNKSMAGEQIFFPLFENTNSWTGLAVANPDPDAGVSYKVIIRDKDGNVLSSKSYELPPKGQTAFVPGKDIADLDGKLASMEIDAENHVDVLALVGNGNMKQISANYDVGANTWTIPHLATKDGWSSILRIQNNFSSPNLGIVKIYTRAGELFNSYELTIPGKGVAELDLGKEFGEVDGSVVLKFNEGISSFMTYKDKAGVLETSLLPVKNELIFGDAYVEAGTGFLFAKSEGDDKISNPTGLEITDLNSGKTITAAEFNLADLEGEIKTFIANDGIVVIKDDSPIEISGLKSEYYFYTGERQTVSCSVKDEDAEQRLRYELYGDSGSLLEEGLIENSSLNFLFPAADTPNTRDYTLKIFSESRINHNTIAEQDRNFTIFIAAPSPGEHPDSDYGQYN